MAHTSSNLFDEICAWENYPLHDYNTGERHCSPEEINLNSTCTSPPCYTNEIRLKRKSSRISLRCMCDRWRVKRNVQRENCIIRSWLAEPFHDTHTHRAVPVRRSTWFLIPSPSHTQRRFLFFRRRKGQRRDINRNIYIYIYMYEITVPISRLLLRQSRD